MNYGNLIEIQKIEVGSAARRRTCEAGHNDYFGRNSSFNNEQQLQRKIEQNSYQSRPTPQPPISLHPTSSNSPDPTSSPNDNKPTIIFTVAHRTSCFEFDNHIQIRFTFPRLNDTVRIRTVLPP